jgi:hypothetical protein
MKKENKLFRYLISFISKYFREFVKIRTCSLSQLSSPYAQQFNPLRFDYRYDMNAVCITAFVFLI